MPYRKFQHSTIMYTYRADKVMWEKFIAPCEENEETVTGAFDKIVKKYLENLGE